MRAHRCDSSNCFAIKIVQPFLHTVAYQEQRTHFFRGRVQAASNNDDDEREEEESPLLQFVLQIKKNKISSARPYNNDR